MFGNRDTGGYVRNRHSSRQNNNIEKILDDLYDAVFEIAADVIDGGDNAARYAYRKFMSRHNYACEQMSQLVEDCVGFITLNDQVDLSYGVDKRAVMEITPYVKQWIEYDICAWLINTNQAAILDELDDHQYSKVEEGCSIRNRIINQINNAQRELMRNDRRGNDRRYSGGGAFDDARGFDMNQRRQNDSGRQRQSRPRSGARENSFVNIGYEDNDYDDREVRQPKRESTRPEVTKSVKISEPEGIKFTNPKNKPLLNVKGMRDGKNGEKIIVGYNENIKSYNDDNVLDKPFVSYPIWTMVEVIVIDPKTGKVSKGYVNMSDDLSMRAKALELEQHLAKEDRFYKADPINKELQNKPLSEVNKVQGEINSEIVRMASDFKEFANEDHNLVSTKQEACLYGLRNHLTKGSDLTVTRVIEVSTVTGYKKEEAFDKIYSEKLSKATSLVDLYSTLNLCYNDTSREFFDFYNNKVTAWINDNLIHFGIEGDIDDFSKDYEDMIAGIRTHYSDSVLARFLKASDGYVQATFQLAEEEVAKAILSEIEDVDKLSVTVFSEEYAVANIEKSVDFLGFLFTKKNKSIEIVEPLQPALHHLLNKLLNTEVSAYTLPSKVIVQTSDKHRIEVYRMFGEDGSKRIFAKQI